MNDDLIKTKNYKFFKEKTLRKEKVGQVRCYLKAMRQNPLDEYGRKRVGLERHNAEDFDPYSEVIDVQYDITHVYWYEVCANDGSYRKCTTFEEALTAFAQLVEFEKRQTSLL